MLRSSWLLCSAMTAVLVQCRLPRRDAGSTSPLEIPFNTTATMGPDGPWNFITLNVGYGPTANVSFFPQVVGDISLLASSANCRTISSLCPRGAEYYDGQATGDNAAALGGSNPSWQSLGAASKLGQSNFTAFAGDVSFQQASFNAPLNTNNITVLAGRNTSAQLGMLSYTPISFLQLDSRSDSNWDADLNKTQDSSRPGPSLSWPLKEASRNGRPQSYNLHMGYAMFDQPGSLYFGGYDSKRIIEPMYRYGSDGISLMGLSFETASGPTIWSDNLLSAFKLGIYAGGINGVQFAPEYPYMGLTSALCDLMASHLPVQYDIKTKLYLWNMSDPAYRTIMSSPSYLNFTFNLASEGLHIKVPFASLNLTLDGPLSSKPVAYLPCYPAANDLKTLVLGRAFLQSANLGYIVDDGGTYHKYIGQAPGPSVGKKTTANPVTFDSNAYTVPSDAPSWQDTWADTWRRLSVNPVADQSSTTPDKSNTTTVDPGSNNNNNSSSNSSTATPADPKSADANPGGLGGGPIAGITILSILLIAAVAAGLWYALVYRRRKAADLGGSELAGAGKGNGAWPGAGVQEMYAGTDVYVHEKDAFAPVVHELSGSYGAAELPHQDYRSSGKVRTHSRS